MAEEDSAATGRAPGAQGHGAVVDAAMALFAARGWAATSRRDVAEAAGISFAELHAAFPTKVALLLRFVDGIDRAVLAAPPEAGASVREALFEVFMRRFDALQPHREAMARLAREVPMDPSAACRVAMRATRSIAAMAELAGVDVSGPLGALRARALAGLHGWVLRAWLADDTQDMARTMKALDQGLARLETLARSLPGARRDRAA
ncbi:MAG: TetR family transcriptional regulator [Alphaproteobacteria bacterium]|nr:TetR family transcriptional regulator [Alphaproteobacteria bacterium]